MKLAIKVKQKEYVDIKLDKVKSYYFDKAYLVVTMEDSKKNWYKASTVLSIGEE